MKKNHYIIVIIICALITSVALWNYNTSHTKQSLTSFPEDQQLSYLKSETTLSAQKGNENQKFKLTMEVESITNKPVYLRQDVGLLYEDGQLVSILNKWKEHSDRLFMSKTIDATESGHFEAISVHHAEEHYPNDVIKGKDKVSYDQLFIMASPLSPLTYFKIPVSPVEREWYHALIRATQQQQHYILEKAYTKYHLNPNHYYIFPISYLHVYNENALPGLTLKETHRVISQLWEGLYKNYIMGIKGDHGVLLNPIGSSIPYILFDKKGSHLYIVTQASNGEIILLKQAV